MVSDSLLSSWNQTCTTLNDLLPFESALFPELLTRVIMLWSAIFSICQVGVASTSSENAFPTDVGHLGTVATGTAPYLRATDPVPGSNGLPNPVDGIYCPANPLETSIRAIDDTDGTFDPTQYFGPFRPYGPPRDGFGVKEYSLPKQCSIEQVHYFHRHGARYPTSNMGNSLKELHGTLKSSSGAKFSGPLSFLDSWEYSLGEAVLTPSGYQQEFSSGVNAWYRYGQLVNDKSGHKLVIRTTSQHRMLNSAKYFLAGFFGLEYTDRANLEVIIEDQGFNNTLAPYYVCSSPNTKAKIKRRTDWIDNYLSDASRRFQNWTKGFEWTPEKVYRAQALCPFEMNAIGYSHFCNLFTMDEWRGFEYSYDLNFFYESSFGGPTGRAQGIGYVNELIRRIQRAPYDPSSQSSENSTLDSSSVYFPLDQKLYFDFSHDSVILSVLAALNLKQFDCDMPLDRLPTNRSFVSSKLVPFGARLATEVISCQGSDEDFIHMTLNDRTIPLHLSYAQCEHRDDGWCKLSAFFEAVSQRNEEAQWDKVCGG